MGPGRGGARLRIGAALVTRLALRNVLRNARRSLLTAAAMVLGLALLVLSRGVADGAHESWINAGVRLGSGHVVLQAPGYRERPGLERRLHEADVRQAVAALAAPKLTPLVKASSVRLAVSGLASSASSAAPVRIRGVEPDAESRFSGLAEDRVEGSYLDAAAPLGAFVGEGLARRLGLETGQRMVLTAQAASGEIVGQLARVRGTFRTGIPEVDDGLVLLPLSTARRWLGASGATEIAVLLHSSRQVAPAAKALRAGLSARGDTVRVLGWREASPELEAAIRIDDYGDYLFHGVLLALVALAILNAVLTSVLHREREFGVLLALGLTARETGGVVFAEGLLLTLLSGLAGVIVGFGVTWIFFRHGLDLSALWSEDITVSGAVVSPVLVPEFRVVQILQSLATVLVMGILASAYPAWRAGRIDPAEAMAFER
jgi:ABC-type lipoprotein release transport system permease subunit